MNTKKHTKGWLEEKAENAEFLRHLAHEDFIEDFLSYVEEEMTRTNVTRAELAQRMKCQPSNVTQLFQRTRNLTSAMMVDIAFHLKLRLRVMFEGVHQRLVSVAPVEANADAAARSLTGSRR